MPIRGQYALLQTSKLQKVVFKKANFTLVLHWCSVFNSFFLCSIFEFSTENIKKRSWDKTVLKIWSQNKKIKK